MPGLLAAKHAALRAVAGAGHGELIVGVHLAFLVGFLHGVAHEQSRLEVELAELCSGQVAVGVALLAVVVDVAAAASAGEGEGASLAVDGEGDEVIVVEAGGDGGHLHGLQVDGAEAVACIAVGHVSILVLEVVGVLQDFVGEVLACQVEEAVDFAVLRVVRHAGRLQAVGLGACLGGKQFAGLGIPLAHAEKLVVGGGGLVAREDRHQLPVGIDGPGVAKHHVEVGGPSLLLGISANLGNVYLRFFSGYRECLSVVGHGIDAVVDDKDSLALLGVPADVGRLHLVAVVVAVVVADAFQFQALRAERQAEHYRQGGSDGNVGFLHFTFSLFVSFVYVLVFLIAASLILRWLLFRFRNGSATASHA